ncbi:hypothetical protein [Fictibacillus barbaricus]|uniref:Membrane-anchored protein n=1 Tax=Fictibacillus barbaricus TaxID=182136 RepID=A0ABU1U0T5_9BACL|nr:hypothetical protein [Fictibacillus barbaricus]MDR7073074.1 putative membrane-anchored protein [Fictibacillus barbaricus]
MKNAKTLKILFIFITVLMIASIIFGVITENAQDYHLTDRLLAGVFGTAIVILFNYLIYKILSKIWK